MLKIRVQSCFRFRVGKGTLLDRDSCTEDQGLLVNFKLAVC